ncbi:hypothetical protein K488DRAFT_74973 [Vararia minispora EC-137]|uniref:Uncharacterized protein n=1 Tax=Vararia minispora EC-137 TaxID=1314806 RepID=A0ACB8Q5M3_9AGAM|nr:hypothetical protein K488DRAFT_74973 [Vararia minispora EC-137]
MVFSPTGFSFVAGGAHGQNPLSDADFPVAMNTWQDCVQPQTQPFEIGWANPLEDDLMLDQPQHPIYYSNGPTPIQGQEVDGIAPEVIQPPAGLEAGLLTSVFGFEGARDFITAFFHPRPVPDIRFEDTHGDESLPRYTVPVTIPLEVAGASVPAESQSQTIHIDVLNEPSALGMPYQQVMFKPGGGPGDASYTRNALKAKLLPTVFFEDMDGRLGVSLNVALGLPRELASVLRDASVPAKIGTGTTKYIRVRRPSGEEYRHQIRLDGDSPKSRMDFLRCNASVIEKSIPYQENLRPKDIKVLCSVNRPFRPMNTFIFKHPTLRARARPEAVHPAAVWDPSLNKR